MGDDKDEGDSSEESEDESDLDEDGQPIQGSRYGID